MNNTNAYTPIFSPSYLGSFVCDGMEVGEPGSFQSRRISGINVLLLVYDSLFCSAASDRSMFPCLTAVKSQPCIHRSRQKDLEAE